MRKALPILLALPMLCGCSAITDLFGERDVRVSVDPVIRQRAIPRAGGDTVLIEPSVERDQIPCYVSRPPTCSVVEFLNVTVHNAGSETVTYFHGCPPPIERREDGDWRLIATNVACLAILRSTPVPPGERAVFPVWLPPTVPFDWRRSTDEFRVVLQLGDEDGVIPDHMRTSQPFRFRLQ